MRYKLKALLRLQHFADGTGADGSGVNGTDAGYQEGVTADVAGQQSGVEVQNAPAQDGQQEAALDREAAFEQFIKENKDLYDARVSKTIRQRLAKPQEAANKLKQLTPALDMLGKKYGVDPTNADALVKAIQDDESYYEEEAMERGISVEELKQIRGLERRNAELERQMQEMESRQNADRLYQQWISQAEQVKQIYPSFDLDTELHNETFLALLSNPAIDVRTAFEAVHHNEIVPAAMQYAAAKMEQKVANNVKANGARPTENGMASQAAAATKNDVSSFSDKQIDDILRRIEQGEKFNFG